jgi:hypothetical protein
VQDQKQGKALAAPQPALDQGEDQPVDNERDQRRAEDEHGDEP